MSPTQTKPIHPSRGLSTIALYLLSLAVMIGVYSIYARFLAPLIEGPPNIVRQEFQPPKIELTSAKYDWERLSYLFPADAWEHGDNKILVTEQGVIMFKEFVRLEGGVLEVLPFTLLMNSELASSNSNTKEQPTVLRCNKGARLKFDNPNVDPLGGKSKLESAWLVGAVDIYRPASDPQTDDALEILTSNIQISKKQVFTIDEVRFAFGSHRGQGKQLSIELDHADDSLKQVGFENITGVKRMELAYLKRLQLQQKGNPKDKLAKAADQLINITCSGPFVLDMERRAAVFNDQVQVSMFDADPVDTASEAAKDEINCKRLTVYFDGKGNKQNSSSQVPVAPSGNGTVASGDWSMERLVAEGVPAILISGSHSTRVSGDILSYDMRKEEFVVRQSDASGSGVSIATSEFRVKAAQIAYRMRSGGGLGQVIAQGPGNLLRAATEQQKELYVEWERLLTIEPDQKQHLIIVDKGCHIRFDKTTLIKAQLMKLWLNEIAMSETLAGGSESVKYTYQPDRVVATDQVEILSEQLQGKTDKLTATWVPGGSTAQKQTRRIQSTSDQGFYRVAQREQVENFLSSDSAYRPRESTRRVTYQDFTKNSPMAQFAVRDSSSFNTNHEATDNRDAPGSGENPSQVQQTGFDEPTKRIKKYVFRGDSIDLKMTLQGATTEVQDLTATGNIQLSEVADAQAKSDRPPFTIEGNQLRCVPQGDQTVRVQVAGTPQRPANILSDRMKLLGQQINLDQSANKLWVEGAGSLIMQVKSDSSLPGNGSLADETQMSTNANQYRQVQVQWTSGMVFNGRRVYFEDEVSMEATGINPKGNPVATTATGEGVTLEMNQGVDFQNMESGSQQNLEIREVVIVSEIAGTQRVFNLAKANNKSGLNGNLMGAGIFHQTRDEKGNPIEQQQFVSNQITMDAISGQINAKGPGALTQHKLGDRPVMSINPNDRRNGVAVPPSGSGITFVRVNFDGTASANTNEKRMLIRGNVRTLYSSVDSFDRALNPDDVNSLPADAVKVKCDQLDFAQWVPRNSEEPVQELLAAGNAHVTSGSFEATADQLRYNQANDTLIIEGTARSDAQLWYHPKANPLDRKHLVAQKLIYRLRDQSYEIQAMKNSVVEIPGGR